MSLSNPSLGWEKLRDVFYRIRESNPLSWNKDIKSHITSISSFGTSIATYPKPTFLNDNLIKSIEIFTGAGTLIHSIPWLQSNGTIIDLGWSFEEEYLIVVLRQGIIRCYYNFEGDFNEIDLKLSKGENIIEAQFFGKGCVVMLNNAKFISVINYLKPSIRMLEFDQNESSIKGWTVIPPSYNKNLEVLVSLDNSIVSTSQDETSVMSSNSTFSHLSVSPNGEFIALYNSNLLSIYTVDLQNELSTFQSDNLNVPRDVKWCANDAVIIAYNEELKLVGPSDECLTFYYTEAPIIATEPDGLRLLSDDKLEFLSRVGDSTISTFKLGSTAASAILLDSIDQLDSHSPKADENLTIIKSSLVEAIDDCINAATEEFEPYWQKKLLRAAAFGKASLEAYNPEVFIEVCNILKILNSVRNSEVGMFLTYQGYLSLGFERLVERLLKRKNYKLAIQASKLLNAPLAPVYIHWASTEIKKSQTLEDQQILQRILSKFKKVNQISFAEISQTAFEEGRLKLSTMLLNYEPLPERQIPLLLEMEQDDIALSKAESSGNVDIILYVLIYLKNKLSLAEFFKLLNDKSISLGIFKELFNEDFELVKNFYHQQDNDLKISNLQLSFFYSHRDNSRSQWEQVLTKIDEERKLLVKILRNYDQHSTLGDEVKLIESEIKLLNIRETLSRDFEMDFYSDCGTLNQLLVKLISMNQLSKINKLLAREFKISDTKMTYLIVDTYISQKNFSKLFEISKSSKSPIGYEYHYNELMKVGEHRQASLYVDMCNVSYDKRMRMLFKCNDFKKAAEELFKKKDLDLLNQIYDSENTVAKRLARSYLEQLGTPRND